MGCRTEYERWLRMVTDAALAAELREMDEAAIEDAFCRDLAFGTGGLRGILGAGTNRMNVLTVAKASQGLAEYLLKHDECPSVVIGFDSRMMSDAFAREAGNVFAANGIDVWAWDRLLPVPTVSFAVRALGASAGVMITASHNPSVYNGYKVYGPDGCQITAEAAEEILACIEGIDVFSGVRHDLPPAGGRGCVRSVPERVLDAYMEEVKACSVLFGDTADRNVSIVYTPLNGTGLEPVTRMLKETGFTGVTVVEEQKDPDGTFPTCPYPNPEIREAMELGLRDCRRTGADLLLATDPDCDRCGIAVRDNGGEYRLLSGNEVGLLLLDFVCAQRVRHGRMPCDPVFVKTIVTTDLAERIAREYGVRTVNVLTGFKYIGEAIGRLEDERDFICAFEESYGYLTGSYVRDKDGVNAALMIAEMFAFYRARGIGLAEKLGELYARYGYCMNALRSHSFPGSAGTERMASIMRSFREGLSSIGGERATRTEDYLAGGNGFPKSDVLKFFFEGEKESGSVTIRPSGTEPKLKIYVSVNAPDRASAERIGSAIFADLRKRL